MSTETTGTEATKNGSKAHARAVARAFEKALAHGCDATAYELRGEWYVVTSGTGEGYDFAYAADDLTVEEFETEGWDYSEWCNGSSPTEDRDVAVAYWLETDGRLLGCGGTCTPVLTEGEREVLEIAREEIG